MSADLLGGRLLAEVQEEGLNDVSRPELERNKRIDFFRSTLILTSYCQLIMT